MALSSIEKKEGTRQRETKAAGREKGRNPAGVRSEKDSSCVLKAKLEEKATGKRKKRSEREVIAT